MYDGKQVLRFVNNYKIKDLYLIGNEMNKRIGTGNYDSERTKFNLHYKNINKSNLYQKVKSILENKNIEYSHKTKTNILNGVTFTSGPEFFMTLGLPFKESNRTYQSGDKKGQNILVPDIKSKDDIPSEVTKYFECCMKFLEDLVGKENIVMAQIHKALMNFDTKWYDINFVKVYNKMTNFTNPNERKKEMAFYTLEEFQRFLSVETDLKFRCAFQTLFYCGLRNGELRWLTWNDINFNRSTLTVNKNIVKVPDPKTCKLYTITSPKTSSSYRTIPIPNFLLKDLSDLYNDDANYYGFRDSWYVFGNIDPLAATTLLDRKTKNAFMARVKDIRIHDFRHSCASLLINNGASIALVAKYLRRSQLH